MSANANPLQATPASRNVREFIAVCARHNVPYGDLNCLPTLLRELNANKHFAMHFWSVVAAMDKQSAEPETVLTAIAEAVTGRTLVEVREAGPAHRILVERLERMLAGHDVASEEVAEFESKPASVAESAPPPAKHTAVPGPAGEDVLPIRRVANGKRGRVRRRAFVEPESIAPVTNPAWTRDESLRLVLVPESSGADTSRRQASEPLMSRGVTPHPRRAEPPVTVPLSSYAEDEPRRSAAGVLVAVVLLAILAGGGYLLWRSGPAETLNRIGTSARVGYDSALAAWRGEPSQSAATTTTTASSPAGTTAAVTPPPIATPAATQPPASAPTQAPIVQPASQAAASVQAPTKNLRPAGSGLTPEQSMAVAAAYNQQREALGPTAETTGPAGVVQVPENVMNAHLIASRVPVVPDQARADGVTGVVRMQATINRSGFVSRLHVLQGPTELRQPALAAVSAWRYRPYLVNGQPADVMTTITVDFSSLE